MQNSDGCDIAEEYMENGGSIGEILSIIDSTAKGDLTTALPVFEAIQLLLLRCVSCIHFCTCHLLQVFRGYLFDLVICVVAPSFTSLNLLIVLVCNLVPFLALTL